MLANLPWAVIDVIASEKWDGGVLIALKDQISRPSAEELASNAMWLLPIVKHSPSKARLHLFIRFNVWNNKFLEKIIVFSFKMLR